MAIFKPSAQVSLVLIVLQNHNWINQIPPLRQELICADSNFIPDFSNQFNSILFVQHQITTHGLQALHSKVCACCIHSIVFLNCIIICRNIWALSQGNKIQFGVGIIISTSSSSSSLIEMKTVFLIPFVIFEITICWVNINETSPEPSIQFSTSKPGLN